MGHIVSDNDRWSWMHALRCTVMVYTHVCMFVWMVIMIYEPDLTLLYQLDRLISTYIFIYFNFKLILRETRRRKQTQWVVLEKLDSSQPNNNFAYSGKILTALPLPLWHPPTLTILLSFLILLFFCTNYHVYISYSVPTTIIPL